MTNQPTRNDMKKAITLIFLILAVLTTTTSFGALGCMYNSYQVQPDTYYKKLPKFFGISHFDNEDVAPSDPKNYHFVACTCPCQHYKKLDRRGRCVQCRHFGDQLRSSTLERTDTREVKLTLLERVVATRGLAQQKGNDRVGIER